MWLFEFVSVLQEAPLLAASIGVVFVLLDLGSRRVLVLLAGGAWLLYSVYELVSKQGILCSGECNIRADLLLIYPVLLFLSVAAIASFAPGSKNWTTHKNG